MYRRVIRNLLSADVSAKPSVSILLLAIFVLACGDDGPTHIDPPSCSVAPDGTGLYSTIQAAINASADGDCG